MKPRLPLTIRFRDAFRAWQEIPIVICKPVPNTYIGHFIKSIGSGLISTSIDKGTISMLIDLMRGDLHLYFKYKDSQSPIDPIILGTEIFQNNEVIIERLFKIRDDFFENEIFNEVYRINESKINGILEEIVDEIFDKYLPNEDDIQKLEVFIKENHIHGYLLDKYYDR